MSVMTNNVDLSSLVLNIPHSSTCIPWQYRDSFLIDYLSDEMRIMTDWYTDDLFYFPQARSVKSGMSRLIVDMERFWDDYEEPMSQVGMGAVYSRTSRGDRLIEDVEARKAEMQPYYAAYHKELETAVDESIAYSGNAIIVDCHSFSSVPLPHEEDKSYPRPDICLGTDSYHTSDELTGFVYDFFARKGLRVVYNSPFSGTIVPMKHYKKDKRVASVMIEINRFLYMDEMTCARTDGYEDVKKMISELLSDISKGDGKATMSGVEDM